MYQDYLNCPWPLFVRSKGKLHSSFTIYNTVLPLAALTTLIILFSEMFEIFEKNKISKNKNL